MSSKIEDWHIFKVNEADITTSKSGHMQIVVRIRMPNNFRAQFVRRMIAGRELNLSLWDVLREADIDDAKTTKHRIKKRGPFNNLLPNSVEPEPLDQLAPNPYKVVEFFRKWAKVVPQEYLPEICQEPTEAQWASVKKEADMRDVVKKVKRKQRNEDLDNIEYELMKETLPAKKCVNESNSDENINLAELAEIKKKQKVLHHDSSEEEEDSDEDMNLEELALLKKKIQQRK
jgi:hypothetical protein